MPRSNPAILLCLTLFALPARADNNPVPLLPETTIHFAAPDEAAALIAARDTFVTAMGPFDLAARLHSADPVTVDQYLAHARAQVLPWTDEQRAAMTETVTTAAGLLADARLRLPNLPKRITLVATTGREESNAAYTRGHAIFLPRDKLDAPPPHRLRLFLHELFHVISRSDPALRDRLYRVIGFIPCNAITLPGGPGALRDARITNPDAPIIEHRIEVAHEGQLISVVPVLYSRIAKYDPAQGASLFRFLTFKLMVVEQADGAWQPALRDGEPVLLEPRTCASFLEQIGRNTGYIIHPDEVLADNFVLLASGASQVASPQILVKMGEILGGKPGDKPADR
jgi:hypothetical protein